MKVNLVAFFAKSSVLILILASPLPLRYSIILCLFLTWVYQYVVALIFGVHAMPSMDMACFLGNDKARVNFMSATYLERYEFTKA